MEPFPSGPAGQEPPIAAGSGKEQRLLQMRGGDGGKGPAGPAAGEAGRTRAPKALWPLARGASRPGRGSGAAPRILRLDGLRGRAGLSPALHMEGRAGSAVGAALRGSVPEPRPAGANPSGPSASSRRDPEAANRPRAAAGEEWGEEGERSGQDRSGVPGRPPAPCARRAPQLRAALAARGQRGAPGVPAPPPARCSAGRSGRPCSESLLPPPVPGELREREGHTGGGSAAASPGPGGSSRSESARKPNRPLGRDIFRRVSLHRFVITPTTITTNIIIITIIVITL